MLAELNYQLDICRKEREEEYPDGLENISNIFLSTGFRDWFLREDTVIDKNIKLLQSDSEIEERENFPLFQASDFDLETKYLSRQLHNPNVHIIRLL